jgi:hypothetical protein
MALAPRLRMVVRPPKLRSHLPEKYDRMVNPTEFLQIYSTSIALTGTARSWLMNLPEGTLHSWSELCHQFTANFESAYARPGNETDLHAIQQRPGETMCSFIQQFSQVRNTIPRISNASIVVAFRQGVMDEKMLEKLTTHDIQDVSTLFSMADKCARAAEGRAWHYPAIQAAKGESTMPSAEGQGNKKKKKAGGTQLLDGAPTAAAAAAGGAVVAKAPKSRPIVMTAARSARCTTPRAIPRWSAGRSRSSRNNSVKRCSSAKMVRLPPAGGQAEG